MKKSIKILAASLLLGGIVACNTPEASSVTPSQEQTSSTETSDSGTTTSETSSTETSSTTTSTTDTSSATSIDENHEIVTKETYPGKHPTQLFSQTPTDVVFDGFTFLSGTTAESSSGKTITFTDGFTTEAGASSIVSGGRYKLEGKADMGADGLPIKKAIKFEVGGPGTLMFAAISANGSDSTRSVTILTPSKEEVLVSPGVNCKNPEIITYNYTEAGTYYIYSTVNGFNLYYLQTKSLVEKGVETGFRVDAAAARKTFLKGEEFSSSGILVYAEFSNGNSALLSSSDYSVDASAYNKDVAGTYTIKVTYKTYAEFTYDVTVSEAKDIIVSTSGSANYQNDVRTVYTLGQTINLSNVVVTAVLDNAAEDKIILPSTAYTIDDSNVDTSTEGVYNVSVKYGEALEKIIPITVCGTMTTDHGYNAIRVTTSVAINGSIVEGVRTFRTVKDANDYLLALNLQDGVVIYLDEGTYTEKITITLPHVRIIGMGTNPSVITYSAAAGSRDARGIAYGTQNSSTFAITSSANSFEADNVEFRNDFDYANSTLGDKQAVAVVVEGDEAVFNDCKFSSFQDTLYAKYGRQLYYNCTIEGAIDFIFGNNAPAYFYNSTIHSLNRGSDTNGGYITATKGTNTGNDVPTYSYVFDDCDFTAEEGVVDGTVSIGRPWAKDATVAVINSRLGAHISKRAYEDNGKTTDKRNYRYETMSGNVPTNAHYVEYNNTGDGALDDEVAGMTFLTAQQAETYTMQNIFAAVNGQLTFPDAWQPAA